MTALDLIQPAPVVSLRGDPPLVGETLSTPVAPAAAIPVQVGPALTVSLINGCELPLEALKSSPACAVTCHPCDEAVVRLLVGRVRRTIDLFVCPSVLPGTLRFD